MLHPFPWRWLAPFVLILSMLAARSPADPTASDEYMALQAELDEANQEIAAVERALAMARLNSFR